MSTLSVSDLMRELQAGEEARAAIPRLESAAAEYLRQMNAAQAHNGALESNIANYKLTIADLNAKIARLEVERDDAGFRELETQDKLNVLLNVIRSVQHDVGEAVLHIDPPKPEPVAQQPVQDAAVPMTEAQAGSTNVPITDHGGERVADPTSVPVAPAYTEVQTAAAGNADATPGQSDPRPTAPSTEASLPPASGDAASPSDTAPSMNDPQAYRPFGGDAVGVDKPNTGKSYHLKPDVMTWEAWIASGGDKPYWL